MMSTEKLIVENKWFADMLASRYVKTLSAYGYDLEDLKQEGYIAMWKASKKYDKDKKMSFVNYSSFYIRARFRDLLKKKNIYTCELKDVHVYEQEFDELEMLLDVSEALKKDNNEIAKAYFCLKLEGLNEYEIARLCGKSQPAVYRSIQRTIKRIRKNLKIEN